MTETATPPGPLAFAASFPHEERFAATAAELAARLASAAGCLPAACEELRGAVEAAFREALASTSPGGPDIDLRLRTTDAAFDADVVCGRASVFHCSRPRTA